MSDVYACFEASARCAAQPAKKGIVMSRFCRLLCILLVFLCGLTSVGKSNETHDLRIRITTQEGVDLGYGLTRNPDNAGLKDVCNVVRNMVLKNQRNKNFKKYA